MKHQKSFIKRCRALPCLLLRAFLLGMLLTESLAVMAGFALPTAAAYAYGSKSEEGKGQPNLFISKSHLGGDHFQVGDDVTFIIVVGNDSHAGPTTSTITVSDSVPIGMHNLRASGHGWDITTSDTKSPAIIIAKYLGNDPVYGGEILPAIKISGKLTEETVPRLTNTARVHTGCDCDTSNNKAIDTIFVAKEGNSQECNGCEEKKEHQGCKEREECQDKSGDSTQGESSATNTASPTTTPVVPSSIAISSVAVASSNTYNTYNIFGGVEGVSGFNETGDTSGSGGVGSVPGLPNTGSDPSAGGQQT
ncbi:MAG TPA: hypothetical protein VGL94_22905 [Ktedonobacteraceae bacterium]